MFFHLFLFHIEQIVHLDFLCGNGKYLCNTDWQTNVCSANAYVDSFFNVKIKNDRNQSFLFFSRQSKASKFDRIRCLFEMINVEIFVHVTTVTEIFAVVRRISKKILSKNFSLDTNVDKSLSPVPLVNKTLEDNPIYSTPIVVIAGSFSFRFSMKFLLNSIL